MKKPKKHEPHTLIQNCTFEGGKHDTEAVTAIARALESTAEALLALANRVDRSAPMIEIKQVGTKD